MLLKRSVVLAGKRPVGYVNFIRFGNTLGAKLRLNVGMKGVLSLSVNGERQFFSIDGEKQELELNLPFDSGSVLGGVLANERGEMIAWGGKSEDRRVWERAYAQWRDATEKAETALAEAMETAAKEIETSTETAGEAVSSEKNGAKEAVEDTAAEVAGAEMEFAAANRSENRVVESSEVPETNETDGDGGSQSENEQTPDSEARTADDLQGTEQKAEKERFMPFEMPLNENFYAGIRARLEEALTVHPREEDLERLIPESKWVKVFYEDDDYYVIGEVREDGAPRLVGYGVPGVADVVPPEEVRGVTDFLPTSEGKGYWLLFQSADNGEILPN